MMAFRFGDFADLIYKCESLLEIWKAEFADEMMFVCYIPQG